MEIWELVVQQAAAYTWVDWTATGLGVVYVILAALNQPSCWLFGIGSCALWAYASYAYYGLFLDALLQLFYVGMGFWGLYQWQVGTAAGTPLPIREIPVRQHGWLLLGGGMLTLLLGYIFSEYTSAQATYWDALTTVFSMIATFLLVQRILSNWLYWLVVDAIYVVLYASRGAHLFALLMVLYLVIATVAFLRWRRERGIRRPAVA